MSEIMKRFSIDDVQMYRENNEDMDFAEVEIWALAEGNNSHRNPISKEVLEKDADTFKGKFVVAEFDKWTQDVTSHVPNEGILGYVDPREEIQFKTKEVKGIEKEFIVVRALLSKIYATDVIEMFRKNNSRTVSCEFSCITEYEENEKGIPLNEFGQEMYGQDNPILTYHIHGITILGLKYNPSIKGTEIKVKRFAEEINYVSHPMKKDEYVTSDWDGDKAKHDAIKEKNFDTMAKSIFLKLDSDYKERKIGSLHYPVMGLYDGVWKYNAEGLSSARAYGEQHDPSVADKAIAIQKKLGLYKDDKEDKMEDNKEFESNAEEIKEDIIMAEDEKEKEMSAEQPQEKEMAENEEEVKEEPKDEEQSKEMAEQPQEDNAEEKEMGCGEKEMSENEDDKDNDEQDEKEEEKKFSLKEYATLTFESETDEIKTFAEKVSEMSADEILTTIVELKKFQEARLSQDRDMKLQQIMASVKCDLDTKKFSELQEEGSKLSLDELGGFENKVKAFAYEATKNKEHQNDDGLMRFSNGESQEETKAELTADDIFNKYL